jgi:hypothetical protein
MSCVFFTTASWGADGHPSMMISNRADDLVKKKHEIKVGTTLIVHNDKTANIYFTITDKNYRNRSVLSR